MKKIYILGLVFLFGVFNLNAQNRFNNQTILLETCGVLSAQGIYLSLQSVGTLADGYVYGSYTEDEVIELLTVYITMFETTKQQFDDLLQSRVLDEIDSAYIAEISNIYDLVIGKAEAFGDYVLTGDESYIEQYEYYRISAWEQMEILFDW